MDKITGGACNGFTDVDCEKHCGYYKHFCPMWTEAQGETINDTE